MNNSNINNTGILPNYLNMSSSDNKYLFSDNTSVEFNQFYVLKNNYFTYFENDNNLQQENQKKETAHNKR
jgi:hypothetical protein